MSNRRGIPPHSDESLFDYPDANARPGIDINRERERRRKANPEEQKKRARRTIRRRKVVLFALVFVLVIILALQFWKINDLELYGLNSYSQADIEALCPLKGQLVYRIRKDEVKKQIESDPRFVLKDQGLVFPASYRLEIQEREEYAVIQYMQQYIYIDQDGMVLDISSELKENDSLLIIGMGISGYARGERLGVHDEYQLYVLSDLLHALDKSGQRGWFVSVDITNAVDLKLLSEHRIWVSLGQPIDLEAKLNGAVALLHELELEGKEGGTMKVLRADSMIYSAGEGLASSSDAQAENLFPYASASDTSGDLEGEEMLEAFPAGSGTDLWQNEQSSSFDPQGAAQESGDGSIGEDMIPEE